MTKIFRNVKNIDNKKTLVKFKNITLSKYVR